MFYTINKYLLGPLLCGSFKLLHRLVM